MGRRAPTNTAGGIRSTARTRAAWTVRGQVEVEARSGAKAGGVVAWVTPDARGRFMIRVQPGTYQVRPLRRKSGASLGQPKTIVTRSGQVSCVNFTLYTP